MKFLAITLLLLTSIFLIACSANQANKKISNSELENLAKQYGGVYIFNQKFVDEIEKMCIRDRIRIWLKPDRLAQFKLTPSDVISQVKILIEYSLLPISTVSPIPFTLLISSAIFKFT